MKKLKVGDLVLWRGAFGSDSPKKAEVESMQRVKSGEKYGDDVIEMDWRDVREECVVSLTNGKWAYGSQISPLLGKL